MPQSRDDDEPKRPANPVIIWRESWMRSLQPAAGSGEGHSDRRETGWGRHMLSSLLRALLGRHVNARRALGLEGALLALATSIAQSRPLAGTRGWRGCDRRRHPVTCARLASGAGRRDRRRVIGGRKRLRLRRAGALDVIEIDELDSVRLSQSLLRAIGDDPGSEWQSASSA